MSVKELDFQIDTNNIIIKTLESKDLAIAINDIMVCLDRNQAHLLYLYLQEHLELKK